MIPRRLARDTMRALMRDRRGLGWDAVLFLVFAGAGWHYAGRLQASGDEPHYLLMAQSLWQERDLDLRDNYARQDFLDYTPGPLQPHYAAPRRDGRPYPAHSPGLPALLAPVYALGGRRACLVMMAALAAWLAREVRLLSLQAASSEPAAWFAWLAAAGPPVFFYSFHVYTEVPSALALALALRLLLAAPSTPAAAVAALAASTLPWLHVKMTLAAAALGVVALARLRGKPRAVFVAIAGAAAAAFVLYHLTVFGHPTPLAIYGGVPGDVLSSSPLRALVGLLLDRSFGLLPYAPVFLLALAGVVPLCRRPAGEWLPHVGVALGVLLPALAWRMWWGGLCPPARFLVPLLPFLSVALASALAAGGWLVRARWALLAAGWLLALFLIWRPEDRLLLNRADQPTRLWEYTLPAVGRWLPSLVSTQPRELVVAAAWCVALGAVLLLDARSRD
jgi:hypothetical protein